MPYYAPSKLMLVFFILFFLSKGLTSIASNQTTNICVIYNEDTRAGKEQKIATKSEARELNLGPINHKLATFFSFLDSLNPSVFQLMRGTLGLNSFYSKKNIQFLNFEPNFKMVFRSNCEVEDSFEPGIYTTRSYYLSYLKYPEGEKLLDTNMLSNFSSLTGRIDFQEAFQLVNTVGISNKEFGFWLSASDYSNSLEFEGHHGLKQLAIIGSRDLISRTQNGLPTPSNAKKMKTGVPNVTMFERVTKVARVASLNKSKYSSFSIKAFKYVVTVMEEKLDNTLGYEFMNYSGSYADLLDQVYNKKCDAVGGDVIIPASRSQYVDFRLPYIWSANRSPYVDFTRPYIGSGLAMVTPTKLETRKVWMFLEPFKVKIWLVTFGIFLYTMFVVWFMEHLVTRGFSVPWSQLGTALWFAFSSIFFSRRKKVQSNNNNVILGSSYTCSLNSMLTVRTLEPTVKHIEWLRKTSAPEGCIPKSFVDKYITDVRKVSNIKNLSLQDEHPDDFKNGNISVAFLKLPYHKYLFKQYFNEYTFVCPLYKFGDLGFIFPNDSPIPNDVSEAILSLLEEGKIRDIENDGLDTHQNCPNSNPGSGIENLSLATFCEMLLTSGLTPTLINLLIFLYRWLHNKIEQHIISFNGFCWNDHSTPSLNHNQVQPSEIVEPTSQLAQQRLHEDGNW